MNEAGRPRPCGLLFDYGGTLVEEVAFDVRPGVDALLANVAHRPPNVTRDAILARVDRVTREVSDRRDQLQIETPWPSITRLIYDYFGVRFARPLHELELTFWDASVMTRPMPGVREVLHDLHRLGCKMGVVSNSSFRGEVIQHELAKHGLVDHVSIIVSSAEYAVRKPNPLLFETAAALLGIPPRDIWFVGDRMDTDVAGARAAGMYPVHFAPSGRSRGSKVLTVESWGTLLTCARDAAA
ncbi:MAG TPA: HAD family hydrolase [Gemmatimonadaceae bacterium]|nr:HAD family hydrolase [Gemmatimonadaceae bacterium]